MSKIKAYSKSELAQLYEVSLDTFRDWVKPIKHELGADYDRKKLLKPWQVSKIFEVLGNPGV